MTIILNHKYEHDELSFEIEYNGERRWVKGTDLKDDHLKIQQYFKELNKKEQESAPSKWNLSQQVIPPPSKILEVLNIDDVPHVLCQFDSFDTPIYVPTRFMRNSYPSLLIQFFEDQILENPEKYDKPE